MIKLKVLFCFFIGLFLFLSFSLAFAYEESGVLSETLKIDENNVVSTHYSLNGGSFSDIRDIVDSAESGDSIFLEGSFKSDGKYISIDKKLDIVSSNGAVLDACGDSRIFVIRSSANFLSIKNLTFKNGFSDARGGAIHLNASDVLIDSCNFVNCEARVGGAISTPNNVTNANNLTIRDSYF